MLAELGLRNVSDQDCENVRYVCSVVSRRAAHLASAGIACLLEKMGENNVTVGIDGSVYRFHPHFHDLMTEKIKQLQTYKVYYSIHNFISTFSFYPVKRLKFSIKKQQNHAHFCEKKT